MPAKVFRAADGEDEMGFINCANSNRSRGAALVELAIALLVLIPVTFGLLEYGWIFFKLSQVNQAARHGVRIAVRPAATDAEVRAAVLNIMTGAGMETGYTVDIDGLSSPVGDPVTVEVNVDYTTIDLIGYMPTPDFLPGKATMAKEGPS